jgi:hypothetical protein
MLAGSGIGASATLDTRGWSYVSKPLGAEMLTDERVSLSDGPNSDLLGTVLASSRI